MSKYTITIEDMSKAHLSYDYMETIPLSDTNAYSKLLNYMLTLPVKTIVENAQKIVFDFDYNFYVDDEAKKKEFEEIFVRHFINQEIAYETESLWKVKLEEFIKLWMPYYKDVYDSYLTSKELLKKRELVTVTESGGKIKSLSESTSHSKESSETKGKATSGTTQIDSDYPQATFDDDIDFATTSATNSTSSNTTGEAKGNTDNISTSRGESEDDHKTTTTSSGYTGDTTSLVQGYNDLIHNINDELLQLAEKALFMKLW